MNIKNIPHKIWLQPLWEDYEIEDSNRDEEDIFEDEILDFKDLDGITFSDESLFDYDIEYIRYDLFNRVKNEYKKLKKKYRDLDNYTASLFY